MCSCSFVLSKDLQDLRPYVNEVKLKGRCNQLTKMRQETKMTVYKIQTFKQRLKH